METKILYGKEVAEAVKEGLKPRIAKCVEKGIHPGLVVVLVGEDPASQVYVRNKTRACESLGIYSETLRLPAETTQKELNELVDQLNVDDRFHGILVQMPLPKHLNDIEIIERISPRKDVDGFHPMNVGRLVQGQNALLPCTPAGVMEMLIYYNIKTKGKHVVIVGRSNIVGKPMLNLMYQKSEYANATVTICHTGTRNMKEYTLRADILIVATGVPEMIKAGMVKEGAVVIDVGVNRVNDKTKKKGYRLVGDVAFDEVKEHCSAITPVPGGVGLMTIAMLMKNTVQAAEDHINLKNDGKK
ncbi:MAG: bifunctional methylenetetrahydrofolate dehydrogenase/methenyltetrahydrofolate cyclohydrolase FolD [Candidatus Neomarinimicrobiota bacterium]|nr:MAG: bifunctional methylenetetrahydrofolate dehydrogenase/methenyltetrahydrofolate cyclohydrolase FolD [Candidatus Neomarinimicrobiota bacterium]